ncbi:SitI3 family protein [Archangium sp.]|uniref:SitI3 family protein n=1 Tax=Archangium sp. TaxID=1872627 RepID=UPI002D3941F6|nr:SitI3 family protein [Archangium sp.]HYO57296.1 SitI3 family protein [Archangium sp.]
MTWNGKNSHYLLGPTIEIDVSDPSQSWQWLINDGFQFIPTLLIGFRFKLKSDTDYDTSSQIMFDATMLLLEHAQDAVLLSNYELIVLQRLGGQLTFNSDHHMWSDDWLKSRLTIPFEHRPLPSPLL